MKSCLVQYYNCQILWRHSLINEDLWVKDGIIQDPMYLFFKKQVKPDLKVDCHGLIIAPGYIDIHLNGGFEVDFSSNVDDTESGLEKVAKSVLQFGVTSFCPTIVTSPDHIYEKILPKFRNFNPEDKASILGAHLEGPFISVEKRGAHPMQYLKEMEEGFETVTKTYGNLENVALVTLAPELKNSSNVIQQLSSRNIKVAIGHSITGLVQAEDAVNNGASLVTHLFNASRLFYKRDPGVFGLLTSKKVPKNKQIYYSVIADGLHTHPATLRLAYKTSPKGVILITDAITAMGLEPGTYQLGQQQVTIDGVGAYLTESNILAGSIATLSKCVQNYYSATGSSLAEAIEAATLHPAQFLGVEDRKGTLEYGTDADFVILDEKLNVLSTFVAGKELYHSPECEIRNFQFSYIKSEQ